MRVLVVEDNADLARSIKRSLRAMDHAVDVIDDGEDASVALRTDRFDLVVLDLTLPGRDGLEVLKEFRDQGGVTPVLILTARVELDARVSGLDLGADDYLTKPFEVAELEARVRALLRRSDKRRSPLLRAGPISFDTVTRIAESDGAVVDLTPRERSVLEVLIRNTGRVVAKDALFEKLFGYGEDADLSAVEIYVSRLRKKLKPHSGLIRTVRGLGYMMEQS